MRVKSKLSAATSFRGESCVRRHHGITKNEAWKDSLELSREKALPTIERLLSGGEAVDCSLSNSI